MKNIEILQAESIDLPKPVEITVNISGNVYITVKNDNNEK